LLWVLLEQSEVLLELFLLYQNLVPKQLEVDFLNYQEQQHQFENIKKMNIYLYIYIHENTERIFFFLCLVY